MLEKLLLAVVITFCLNLFLAVRLQNATPDPNYLSKVSTKSIGEAATAVLA